MATYKLNYLSILLILLLALALCPLLGGHCGLEGLENNEENNPGAEGVESDENEAAANPASVIRPKYIEPKSLDTIESRKKTDIPEGQEDLYVLRSEVANLLNKPSCPPCPPCGRCPEPSFSCKKVPNYNNVHAQNFLPKPVVNDFSTFAQ